MVALGRKHSSKPTITPTQSCSVNFTDASKEGLGAHLGKNTERGTCSRLESKVNIHYPELKAVSLALKEFQDLCLNKTVLIATANTTVVAYINKEGGMKSGLLCALLWRILTWFSRKLVTPSPTHSRQAECHSRQFIQSLLKTSSRFAPGGTNLKWTYLPPDLANCFSLYHRYQTP